MSTTTEPLADPADGSPPAATVLLRPLRRLPATVDADTISAPPVDLALTDTGRLVPWLWLGAIAVAELVTTMGTMQTWLFGLGVALHAIILLGLPLHAMLARGKRYQRLLLALTIGPLIRIMSLTLPLASFPLEDWYVLVSVPLFVCAFMLARVLRLGPKDLGLRWRCTRAQAAIALFGFAIGWGESRILPVHGLAASWSLAAVLPPALILLVCTGFEEELLFRGLLQRTACGIFFDDGILYVSMLFAILHAGYGSVADVIFVFLVGVLFAVVARRTGSIFGTTMSHGVANITLYVIVPLLAGGP